MMSKRFWSGVAVAAVACLSGCGGGFFIDSATTGTVSSASGDYVYAVNPGTQGIYQYTLAGGALSPITTAPVSAPAGLVPTSIAVSRANTYVYVGGVNGISSYSIGSTGGLTLVNATAASYQATKFVSLDVSPDGQWLLALEGLSYTVYVFKINTSTGAIVQTSTATYTPPASSAAIPQSVKISANSQFVATALGAGGDGIFTFNTSNGAIAYSQAISPSAGYFDNAVQFDGTGNNVFVARLASTTGGSQVLPFTVASNGAVTQGTAIGVGNGPSAALLENGGGYLYVANRLDATLSGFSVSGGVLAALPGSPYSTGPSGNTPQALVEDRTHKYVVAASGSGNVDLTLYSLDALTPGKLDAVGTATSGASGITNLAATHSTP